MRKYSIDSLLQYYIKCAEGLHFSRGGSRGGLRVLEHPPKLPKVNYLLLLLINLLSEFKHYRVSG